MYFDRKLIIFRFKKILPKRNKDESLHSKEFFGNLRRIFHFMSTYKNTQTEKNEKKRCFLRGSILIDYFKMKNHQAQAECH